MPQTVVALMVAILWGFGFVGPAAGIAAAQENWAESMFEVKEHDFRTVGRGTKAEYYFEFTNPYKETLHVAAVRTSCGCTTPSVTQSTIETHGKAAVVAKFNTATFIGDKAATITVVFDRPRYAEVRLKVKGHIRTDITFDPPEINFGQFDVGTPRQQEVVITRRGASDWKITDVRSHCENLRVALSAPEKQPGLIRYRMQVKLDENTPEGDLRHRLTLISDDKRFPTTEMAITGRVKPAVELTPKSVALGNLRPSGAGTKRIIVKGKEPFAILGVDCPDDRFTFDLPEGKKKLQMVTLNYQGDGGAKPIACEVRVVTDLPGERSAKCIVTGTVR
ncbi:MAG: DUF1573 domain-containing protein [Planctomycetota bacterium]